MNEVQGPEELAFVNFQATTKDGSPIFLKMIFHTLDASGWQLVQGTSGEIYPFSNEIEPKVLLVSRKTGSVLGSRDVSACLK